MLPISPNHRIKEIDYKVRRDIALKSEKNAKINKKVKNHSTFMKDYEKKLATINDKKISIDLNISSITELLNEKPTTYTTLKERYNTYIETKKRIDGLYNEMNILVTELDNILKNYIANKGYNIENKNLNEKTKSIYNSVSTIKETIDLKNTEINEIKSRIDSIEILSEPQPASLEESIAAAEAASVSPPVSSKWKENVNRKIQEQQINFTKHNSTTKPQSIKNKLNMAKKASEKARMLEEEKKKEENKRIYTNYYKNATLYKQIKKIQNEFQTLSESQEPINKQKYLQLEEQYKKMKHSLSNKEHTDIELQSKLIAKSIKEINKKLFNIKEINKKPFNINESHLKTMQQHKERLHSARSRSKSPSPTFSRPLSASSASSASLPKSPNSLNKELNKRNRVQRETQRKRNLEAAMVAPSSPKSNQRTPRQKYINKLNEIQRKTGRKGGRKTQKNKK